MKNIQKLKKTPIIEALFEIRFSPNDLSVGEMLPGLLYAILRDEFPSVLPLPMANAPLDFREQNENLKLHNESTNLDPQFADILEERMLDLYA